MIVRHRPYELHVFDDIADVSEEVWDALIDPDDVQASHRFVSVCQDAGIDMARLYPVMIHKGGRLEATAVLSFLPVNLELLAPRSARGFVTATRAILPRFLRVRVLFCGLPVSFGQSCLRFSPEADVRGVLQALTAFMDDLAEKLGAHIICFKEFGLEYDAILQPLTRLGYIRAMSLPACSMSIPWTSFEAYLSGMRSGYRRQVRATLRVREQKGLHVRRITDFRQHCPRVFGLYEQVMDRADHQLERLTPAFFTRLNERLGTQSSVILLEHEHRLLAAAVLLQTHRVCTFLLAGIDYEQNRSFCSYLNLVTEVVAEAIRSGARRLVLGQTSYAVKQRLGGNPTPLFIYLRCRSRPSHYLLARFTPLLFPAEPLTEHRVFKTEET